MESLFITLLIIVIVAAIIWWIIGKLPLPEPFAQLKWVLYAIVAIIVIVKLLEFI